MLVLRRLAQEGLTKSLSSLGEWEYASLPHELLTFSDVVNAFLALVSRGIIIPLKGFVDNLRGWKFCIRCNLRNVTVWGSLSRWRCRRGTFCCAYSLLCRIAACPPLLWVMMSEGNNVSWFYGLRQRGLRTVCFGVCLPCNIRGWEKYKWDTTSSCRV